MIFATDAHVEESEQTFAALRGRQEFNHSAPRVIEGYKKIVAPEKSEDSLSAWRAEAGNEAGSKIPARKIRRLRR